MEEFIKFLNGKIQLNDEDESFLKSQLRLKTFEKGTSILKESQISQAFYFNVEGFVRLFYKRGYEERTAYFYPEGVFISAYESFVKQTPSKVNLEAAETSTLIEINAEASIALLQYDPKFESIARTIMEEELIAHQRIIESLLTLSAEERYSQLMEERPWIFGRIPQQHIASYIGVQPESLSRIKKRYLERRS